MRLVTDAACARFRIDFYNKIEVVMLPRPFAEFHHLRKLVSAVDVQNREGHATEKIFSRQPDENVCVLSYRPRHTDVFESVIRLAKNKVASVLEFVEMRSA